MLNSDSSGVVDLFSFGVGFALQLCGHLREGFGVDLYSALLHAGEHGNEREIDFFVEFGESFVFYFFAERGGETESDVGGFGKAAVELGGTVASDA